MNVDLILSFITKSIPEDLLVFKDLSCFSISVKVIFMLICSLDCQLSGLTNVGSLLLDIVLLFVFLQNANRFSTEACTASCLPPFIIFQ